MINIDLTIIIQLVNFIITIVALNILLIRPVREIIRRRRDLASGFLNDAERFNSDAAGRLEQYEAALANAREQGVDAREAQKNAALRQEAAILSSAHSDAQEFLQRTREETRKAADTAGKELRAMLPSLAAKAARRLLSGNSRSKV